ncbi:MAG: (2Fe-2S)-binding protein, partial [Microvirga sp.]
MTTVSMTVNGQSVTADVDPRTLLVQFLRDHLRLTGT